MYASGVLFFPPRWIIGAWLVIRYLLFSWRLCYGLVRYVSLPKTSLSLCGSFSDKARLQCILRAENDAFVVTLLDTKDCDASKLSTCCTIEITTVSATRKELNKPRERSIVYAGTAQRLAREPGLKTTEYERVL